MERCGGRACKFKIRNTAEGLRWAIGAIEVELRSFCAFRGLSIEAFKSGLLFQTLSFTIKGEAESEEKAREVLAEVKSLVKEYE